MPLDLDCTCSATYGPHVYGDCPYVPRHKAYGLITRGARLRGVIGSTGRAPFPGTSVWVADKYKPRHVA